MSPRLQPRFPAALLLLGGLLLSGCASEGERRAAHPPKPPPPPLAGELAFFDGRVVAELKVGAGAGFGGEARPEGEGRPRGGPGGGRISVGGGIGGMHGGRHGAEGGGPRADREERPGGPGGAASILPPVMIHLRITNRGPERLTVAIVDFLSPLGNFVINPEKLTLDPGQSTEVEPMTSRLDDALDAADVTLALRLPGRTERKTVTLRATPGPTDTPPAGPRPP